MEILYTGSVTTCVLFTEHVWKIEFINIKIKLALS